MSRTAEPGLTHGHRRRGAVGRGRGRAGPGGRVIAGYPISRRRRFSPSGAIESVRHHDFQAEDEIAAICAAIGASYAGQLGVTSSSGPGIALKTEAIGLAVMTELPLIIVNSQRGGPSTGLPTKTEQSDLYQAVYGRNGDAPMPVIAARSPADAFDCAIEAVRIATQYMTPVMLLTDGYIATRERGECPMAATAVPVNFRHCPRKARGDALSPNGDLAGRGSAGTPASSKHRRTKRRGFGQQRYSRSA